MTAHRDGLGWGSKRDGGRVRSANRRRRPVLERLEDLTLLTNFTNVLVVTTTAASGAHSLDQAIRTANSSGVATEIDFNIQGTGPQTILDNGDGVETRFQTIHVPIFFNGWSEGNFQAHGTSSGSYDGPPLIVIDGTHISNSDRSVLDLEGPSTSGPGSQGSIVQGLDIVNSSNPGFDEPAAGIEIEPGDSDITIQGNYIGVVAGPGGTMTAEGIDSYGIAVEGTGDTIGGTTPADRNVIAGNGANPSFLAADGLGAGVYVTGQDNTIEGNYIGVASDGMTPVANALGIFLDGSSSNTIGGTTSGAGNVISGNTTGGIFADGDSNDTIEGNLIGTDSAGDQVGNQGDGIELTDGASHDIIGGTGNGAGNTIEFNPGNGVTVGTSLTDTTVGDDVEGNAISGNGGLGISLALGTTTLTNDAAGHTGPNDFQNYPTLSTATISGDTVTITGAFDEAAEPNTTLTLDFFGDTTGSGQGTVYLGSKSVTSDGNDDPFTATVTAPPSGAMITATATVASTSTNAASITVGDTSEFAPDITPTTSTTSDSTSIMLTPPTSAGTAGQPSNFTLAVTDTTNSNNIPAGEVDIVENGTTTIASGDLDGTGTASIPVTLPAGMYSITATYVGGSGFQGSTTPNATSYVVNAAPPDATSTSLSNPPATGTAGQANTFTVTVADTTNSGTIPTGEVDIDNGSTVLASGDLDDTGTANISVTEPVGTYSITANYVGGTGFQGSATPSATSYVVSAATGDATSTSLSNPPATGTAGQANTFTVVVADTTNSGTMPTGTVDIDSGSTVLASGDLDDTGTANISVTEPVGTYSITAIYVGNSSFQESRSSPPTPYTVSAPGPDATNVGYFQIFSTLTSGQTFANVPVRIVVGVGDTTNTATYPTGEVDILDNGTKIDSGDLNDVGIASINTTLPTGLNQTISAVYVGNSSFQTSTLSPDDAETLDITVPTTSIVAAVNTPIPLIANQPITITANVTDSSDAAYIPTGTVNILKNDTTTIGTGTLDSNGQVTISFTLPAGSYNLSADFVGNSSFAPVSPPDFPIIVNPAQTPTPTSPTPTSPTPTSPTPTSTTPTSTTPTSTTPTSTTPTSTTPTSTTPTSPTPTSPTPAPVPAGLPTISQTKKGLVSVGLSFGAPLDLSAASNRALYQVLTTVKKKGKIVFAKNVAFKSVTLSNNNETVTITLSKPFKGKLEVTVAAGLKAANGTTTTKSFSIPIP